MLAAEEFEQRTRTMKMMLGTTSVSGWTEDDYLTDEVFGRWTKTTSGL